MSGFEYGVTVVFRILNALVVAGVLWYLFKKYMLWSVKQAIAERETTIRNLEQQSLLLAHTYQEAAKQIKTQEQLCSVLLEKVQKWQEVVAQENQKHQAYIMQQTEVLKERLHIQQQAINALRTQEPIVDCALEQAEKNLRQEFSSAVHGQEYIKSVVDLLERA